MSNEIETVKVVADTPSGYAIINAVDYDAAVHVLYGEAPAVQTEKPEEPVERKRRRRTE